MIQDAKAQQQIYKKIRASSCCIISSLYQAATRDLEAGRLLGGLGQSVGQLAAHSVVWVVNMYFSRHNRRHWSCILSITAADLHL